MFKTDALRFKQPVRRFNTAQSSKIGGYCKSQLCMTDLRRKHLGEYVSQVESQKFRIKHPPPSKKIIIKEYHSYPQNSINFVQTKCYKDIHWQFRILSITVSFISGLSYRKRYILRGFLAVQKIASIVAASKYNIKVRSVYDTFPIYLIYYPHIFIGF